VLVVVEGHVQFPERLIQVLDSLGAMSAKVAIGVGLEIMPGAFDLFNGFANDRVPLVSWFGLWAGRNEYRGSQHASEENSAKNLPDAIAHVSFFLLCSALQ
jgi:hypothetical protein